jgi:hypothetical protein
LKRGFFISLKSSGLPDWELYRFVCLIQNPAAEILPPTIAGTINLPVAGSPSLAQKIFM